MSAALLASLLALGVIVGCSRPELEPAVLAQSTTATGAGSDYLDAELRRAVDALVAAAAVEPSTAANCGERARLFWRWSNAWALTGQPVSPDASSVLSGVTASEARAEPCSRRLLETLDEEIRELALRDAEPGAIGSLRFAPAAAPLVAASRVTIEQIYTVGTRAVPVGGGFLLGAQIMADQGSLQNRDPAAEDYVSARASAPGVRFERAMEPLSGRHGGFKGPKDMPVFRVAGEALLPGETVTFTYGDRAGGSPGFRLQTLATENLLLPVYVDVEARGRFSAAAWPSLEVVGTSETAAVFVVGPSVVATGEVFELTVRAEDRYRNRATAPAPGWEVLLAGEKVASVAAGGAALAVVPDLRLRSPGVHRFIVRSSDGELAGVSNPIWAEPAPERRIYWGELHGHAGFAEGQGGAEQFFRYAREDARLDFVSLTDHDSNLDDLEWRTLQEASARHTRRGDMVAFLGYEWSAHHRLGGHHNVIFRSPERDRVGRQRAPALADLYAGLERENAAEDVLVIPHAHMAADWNTSDPDLERLVEIGSMHGTFEWFGNYYLRNGFEVGFIAASDDHRAKPGLAPGLFFSPQVQPGGLAAAVATEKTADAIFDALRGLSAYATSGDRILLEASLDGHRSGTRAAADARRQIRARASGTAPIDRIEVIRNGEVAFTQSYLAAPLEEHAWVQVGFESSSEVFPPPHDNPRVYRVWSGALEVANATLRSLRTTGLPNAYLEWARVDPEQPNRVEFYAETRGRMDTLLLELDGASAATRIELDLEAARESGEGPELLRARAQIPGVRVSLALANLDRSRLEHVLPVGRHRDRLVLQVVDAGGPLDRDFEFTDLGPAAPGDYYYVRVTQIDGAQAWSSPVWVGAPAGSKAKNR